MKKDIPEYQVIARKYRPQTFGEVLGQSVVVAILQNAIKKNRLAHAYLFCGSRGTGKTTLARIFAKALNCQNLSPNFEPCNVCSSCKEITTGSSLEVLEIDGASNRGIDDIRQINGTVGYTTASGKYKIYIIDEVHMLTKEAFNALLKTLEEPPLKVKFLFATTEPHKILPTILSRCQRFNLNRIPHDLVIQKLQRIIQEQSRSAEEEALRMIADQAEGGLRDAESLLEQILAFHEEKITASGVASVLGIMTRNTLFELDHAGKDGNLSKAFEISHQIFSAGKDPVYFLESLTEHIRNILAVKLGNKEAFLLPLSQTEIENYQKVSKYYRQEQCLDILDYLIGMQTQIRTMPCLRIALEAILLHFLRSHCRVPVDIMIRRLCDLETKLNAIPLDSKAELLPQETLPQPKVILPQEKESNISAAPSSEAPISKKKQNQYDTLLQFAAVELEGTIQKKPI
jgi:DNA polymerase-3 subunit gamma/tau